jgi:hypothetical protein
VRARDTAASLADATATLERDAASMNAERSRLLLAAEATAAAATAIRSLVCVLCRPVSVGVLTMRGRWRRLREKQHWQHNVSATRMRAWHRCISRWTRVGLL